MSDADANANANSNGDANADQNKGGDDNAKKGQDANGTGDKNGADGSQGKSADNQIDEEKKGLINELKELRKEKRDREKADEDKANKTLAEQKKFEELSKKQEDKIAALQNSVKNSAKKSIVARLAAKNGAADSDDIYALIGGKIEVSDDGEVDENAVNTLIGELKTAKPYLFGKMNNNIGSGSNPAAGGSGGATITRSQMRDPKFYREHKAEIMQALKEGKIVED